MINFLIEYDYELQTQNHKPLVANEGEPDEPYNQLVTFINEINTSARARKTRKQNSNEPEPNPGPVK